MLDKTWKTLNKIKILFVKIYKLKGKREAFNFMPNFEISPRNPFNRLGWFSFCFHLIYLCQVINGFSNWNTRWMAISRAHVEGLKAIHFQAKIRWLKLNSMIFILFNLYTSLAHVSRYYWILIRSVHPFNNSEIAIS